MHTVKSIVTRLLMGFIYALSFIAPRKKNIWLFGSYAGGFNDNSKYFFIYVHEKQKELGVLPVWISSDTGVIDAMRAKGFKVYYRWSSYGIFYSLRAGIYIYSAYVSDINLWTSGRTLKINLWHGVPLKKIEFDIKTGVLKSVFNGSLMSRLKCPAHYVKPNYMLSTSEVTSRLFASAFRVSIGKCLNFGYPRNSILRFNRHEVIEFIKTYESEYVNTMAAKLEEFNGVYVYMPTWRDGGNTFYKTALPNIDKLNSTLKRKKSALIIKAHANTQLKNLDQDFSNIFIYKNNQDIYPILSLSSMLITDYSSILFDYLHSKKPIIFYPFDKYEYISEREMYFEYESLLIGQNIIKSFNDLIMILESTPKVNEASLQLKALAGTNCEEDPNVKLARFIRSQ